MHTDNVKDNVLVLGSHCCSGGVEMWTKDVECVLSPSHATGLVQVPSFVLRLETYVSGVNPRAHTTTEQAVTPRWQRGEW